MTYQESRTSLKAMIVFFALLFFVAIFGSLSCGLWYGYFTARSTQLEGIETTAVLEEKSIEDRWQTRYWFTYRFTTLTDETYLSSVEVNETLYNTYQLGDALPLRYQADNPSFNSLEILYTDLRASLWSVIGLSALVMGISTVLGVSLFRFMSG